MGRASLVAYLALAMAVGPALCCCLVRPTLPPADEASAPEKPVAACCRHAEHHRVAKHNAKPKPERCPCRESGRCQGVLPPALKSSPMAINKWLVMDSTIGVSPVLQIALHIPRPILEVASHRPFWETADLLDVQHKLRC